MLRKIIYLCASLFLGLGVLNAESNYACYVVEQEQVLVYSENKKTHVVIFDKRLPFQGFDDGWLIFGAGRNKFKVTTSRPSAVTFVSKNLVQSGVPEKEHLASSVINKMDWKLSNMKANLRALKFFLNK